jgi:hypothetical protein
LPQTSSLLFHLFPVYYGQALHHPRCRSIDFFGGFMKTRFAIGLVIFCVALAPATVRSEDPQSQYSQSPDDQGACMADAFAVCGQFIPDRERVGNCLVANASRISPACREAIKRFVPRTAAR